MLLLLVCTLLCMVSGVASYSLNEKEALRFIQKESLNSNGIYAVKAESVNKFSSYYVIDGKLIGVDGVEASRPFKCRVSGYFADGVSEDEVIFFTGKPIFQVNDEDEIFDGKNFLRSRGIFITFPTVEIISSDISKQSMRTQIRSKIKGVIYKYTSENDSLECADVSVSMLLGDKRQLDRDIKNAFTESGIIHLMCVSGMHISVIISAVAMFLGVFGVGKRLSAVITVSFCFIYLFIIGFPISAMRAGIICTMAVCGGLLGRSTEAYTSLFASLIIICIFSPYSVLDISAQLSFFSSLGIIAFTDLFSGETDCDNTSAVKRIFGTIKSMLSANCGAVIFTFPICAYSFGKTSTVSVPATLLSSFFAEFLLTLLLILVILSPLSRLKFLLNMLGFGCQICSKIIISVAKFFSSFRYAYNDTETSIFFILAFVVLTSFLCVFIYLDSKKLCIIFVTFCSALSLTIAISSVALSIIDDGQCKISYFRQNENDRQLSLKLARNGYLIVNADNKLCTDETKADFDKRNGNNYLLIIPDELITPSVLAVEISNFNDRFGVRAVFVPKTDSGAVLKSELYKSGIASYYIDDRLSFGKFSVSFEFDEKSTLITVDEKNNRTSILFADEFVPEKFPDDCNTTAFFTRKTAAQFNPSVNSRPSCDLFVTRMKKDKSVEGILNTFGLKNFYIKE